MQVNRPILYVLFAHDPLCAAASYLAWFEQFQLGMNNPPGQAIGARRETLAFFIAPGTHDDGQKLFNTFNVDALQHPELVAYWHGAMAAVRRRS